MNHAPLNWIKDNLIFLPISGPLLKGHSVGKYILPFQEDIVKSALRPDGSINKNVFMGYSRKISKSLIFSWIYNYLLENREGLCLVNMASTFSQSNIIYSLISSQILLNPLIEDKHYKIRKEELQNLERHNHLYKIFSKASSNLGMLNVSGLIADEVGAMQSRENINSILSGMALAQEKPLLLFSSNPPEFISHWSTEYIKTLRSDSDWDFYDFSAPLNIDPFSEEAKVRANPFYKEFIETQNPTLASVKTFIDKEAEKAKKSSENLAVYRRFQLGQRISAKEYEWISVSDIQIVSEDILKDTDLRAILGFDLAFSNDFCACVLCLYNESSEDIYLYPFLHLANTENRRPNQRTLFESWHKAGYINLQNAPAIDKSIFCADVKNFLNKHDIKPEKYVWDRNLSSGWTEEFSDDPELLSCTARELSQSIRFLEARSKEKKIHFIGKNDAFLKQFEDCIVSAKSKGYCLLDRYSRFESIDGPFCVVMATKYFLENREQKFYGFAI